MNYLPRMLQKLKKMRYFRNFCSLLSKNLRLAQNLPNEVFVYKFDFKVDIPYTETLRISLLKTNSDNNSKIAGSSREHALIYQAITFF